MSNSVAYRNTSLGNAQGRSGAATLTARALLGRDNVAVLEVSTGELDRPAAAPGSLDKVQVKTFALGTDRQLTNENFRTVGTGGYWSRAYPRFMRGQRIQVQAIVSGIDPTRSDVVTLSEDVKWRPDLRPGAIGAPARALVGAPVNVVVPVAELNGDVGARGDCILYADGLRVDGSLGIWVDAGDVVSCLFRTTFAIAGTKRLEVAIENVLPADYDPSNNRAVATITVVDPVASFHGSVTASNEVTGTERATGRASLYPRIDDLSSFQRRSVRTTIDAEFSSTPLTSAEVVVSRESDGQTFGSTRVVLDLSGGCAVRVLSGQYFSVCASGGDGYQLFWTTVQGTVAYWSLESQTRWNGTQYVYTSTGLAPDAPPQPERWGSSLTLHLGVNVAGREIRASPVVTLVPFDFTTSEPYSCVAGGCTGLRTIRYGISGQAVF